MGWKVREGVTVDHSGSKYGPGAVIPCSDSEAAQMPHAVEKVEPVKVEADKVEPVTVKAEPVKFEEPKAQTKRTK